MDEFKLTKEDLAIAEKNGIHEGLARQRYEVYMWEKERAITQKPRVQQNLWPKYKDLCEKNGIVMQTFYGRLARGWEPEKAATDPVLPPNHCAKRKPYKRKQIPEEFYDLALKNGIKRTTIYQRVHTYKWDFERAATEPIDTNRRKRNTNFNLPIEKRSFK